MKAKEFRDKSDTELVSELANRQKQLFALRTQTATEKVQDTSQAGKIRKDVARIKTIVTQRKPVPTT